MPRPLLKYFLLSLAIATACPAITKTPPATPAPAQPAAAPAQPGDCEKKRVMVIPVQGAIDNPTLYIVRRGLKEAAEKNYDAVIIDMKTPGGAVSTTFDIIEALKKFPGKTFTFVNDEAISAGALISAGTDEIWLSPKSVIGASAAVMADGQDIAKTMQLKITSFIRGKIRVITEGHGFRGQVIEAMIDENFELKIGDTIISSKGELLSLTATEAVKTYGDPPQSLLGAGIAKDIDDLLAQKFGDARCEITKFETNWSEKMGSWLSNWLGGFKMIIIGLGLLALFTEFKTPGFGFFGIAGLALLGLVFLMSYGAGLSGHEPAILFTIGLLLVVAEFFFFPGTLIAAITGFLLMLCALVWAMADIWPKAPPSVTWSPETFAIPVANLALGLLVAAGLGAIVIRYLPKGWFFQRLAVAQAVAGSAQVAGLHPEVAETAKSLVGAKATAATALMPSGEIEIDGKRYNARLDMGSVPPGAKLIVTRMSDFSLIVEEDKIS